MASSHATNGVPYETSAKTGEEVGNGANAPGLPSRKSEAGVMPIAIIGMACRFPGGSSNPEKLWGMLANKRSGWSKVPAERFTQSSFQHPSSAVGGTFTSQGAHFLEEDVSLFDAPAFHVNPLEAKVSSAPALIEKWSSSAKGLVDQAMDPQMRLLLEVAYESLENGLTAPRRGSGYGRGEGVASIIIKPLKDAVAHGDPIRAVIRNTILNQDGKTPGLTMPCRQAQVNLIREAYQQARLDPLDTPYIEAHGTGTKAGDPIEVEAIATALSETRDPSRQLLIGSVKANIGHLESASGLAGLIKTVLCLEKGMIPPSINFETENMELHLQERCMRVARELEPWPTGFLRRASLNSFGYGGTNAHVILDAYVNNESTSAIKQPLEACDRTTDDITHNESLNLITPTSGCMNQEKVFLISHRTKAGVLQVATDLRQYIISSYSTAPGCFLNNLAYTLNSRRTAYNWRAVVSAASPQELAKALDTPTLEPQRSLQDQRMSFVFTGQGAQWFGMGRELISRYPAFRSILTVSDAYFQSLGSSWSLIDELLKPAEISCMNSAAVGQPLCTAIQCALVELLRSWNIKPASVMGHSSGEIAAAYACGSLHLESALTISYHRGLLASARLERNSKLRGAMLAANVSEADAEAFIQRIRPGRGRAVVACINSPGSVTLAGDRAAIMSLQNMFEARQIFARRLRVGTAYHSHHMELVADSYLDAMRNLPKPNPNRSVTFFSSVTGGILRGENLDAAYWVKNMVSQVKFSPCLQKLHEAAILAGAPNPGKSILHTMLEIGPHGALAGFTKQTLGGTGGKPFRHLSTLSRGKNAIDTMHSAASQLAASGYPVDLCAINGQDEEHPPRVQIDLPPYPWDHTTSHWHEPRLSIDYRKRSVPRHPLLGAPTPDFNRLEPNWRNIIRVSEIPWIRGHVIQSNIVYPAAGYLAMAVEASFQRARLDHRHDRITGYRLKNIFIGKPLIIPDNAEGVETQFVLRPYNQSARKSSDAWNEFRLFSHAKSNGWSEHCRGLVALCYYEEYSSVEGGRELTSKSEVHAQRLNLARATCKNNTNSARLYELLGAIGFGFEGAFRCVEDAAVGGEQSLGHVRIPNTMSMMPGGIEHPHVVHPSTLDACMQMTSPILMNAGFLEVPMVPTFIKQINIASDLPRTAGQRLFVHADTQLQSKTSFKADITASQENAPAVELPVIELHGLVCTAVPGVASAHSPEAGGRCHKLRWELSLDFIPSDASILTNGLGKSRVHDVRQVTLIKPACPTSTSEQVISSLSSSLGERLVKMTCDFEDVAEAGLNGSICICLIEFDNSILKTCTATQWNSLRQMLSSASRVLWVTKGGTMDVHLADAGLITGLARTARLDNPALRLITYDIDSKETSPEETADSILLILEKSFRDRPNSDNTEDVEFAQRSGQIYVPRVVKDQNLQLRLASQSSEPQVETQKFFQPGRSLRLEVATPGLLDSLRFVEDTTATAPIAPHELRIQPRAYGVNFRDVMIALGQLEDTSLMSSESSGVVTEIGDAVADEFQVGDRICSWNGNAFAGSVTVSRNAVQRIPENMTFETAASIPIVYATVYYGLVHLGRLQKGESVLIHSAAGGVGQAAVMLAQHIGANIFATVGSNDKKKLLVETYGIPQEHIFSSRHLSFANGIKRLTDSRVVDVVLNSLAGEAFHETFECLAKLGRFIEIGKRDILANSRLDMATFNKSVTFASVDLTTVFEQDPILAKRMIEKVFALLATRMVQPVQPLNVFSLSEVESAFRLIQAGKHTGKVVLRANQDTTVKALLRSTALTRFSKDVSYILIGGLGGLGRALCHWLRVIHSAMVIRDNIIDKMTWEDYHAALRPKVQGTLNIHEALLDTPLDFFVMLSSCVGIIGNNGQANYASACTFQDAFCRYRSSLGMPTRSIDVGMVEDAGYVSENNEVYRFLTAQGFRPIKVDELFAAIDYAISQPIHDADDCQLMIGLTDPQTETQAINFTDAKFSHIRSTKRSGTTSAASKSSSMQSQLQNSTSDAEMHTVVREAIAAQVAKVLVVPAEDISASQSISKYGVDSLSAVELRNWFAKCLDAPIGVMEILSGKSIDTLTSEVLVRSKLVQHLRADKVVDGLRNDE
ncbi:MAG: hypothetical protein Q9179_002623 [Wetmoreana sp. 5 TL-2023]